jgi:hypothetical protein
MNILVTGANGQLGNEMRIVSKNTTDHYIFTDVNQVEGLETTYLDITDMDAIRKMVKDNEVQAIVNCAAWTNVDACETDEKLAALAEKLNADAPENIHSHIEYGTLHAAHQLRLGEWRALEMKSAHHAIGRHTLVVLAEMDRMAQYRSHLLVKFTQRETLEEIATGILEDARLNDEHAINISFDYFHILVL